MECSTDVPANDVITSGFACAEQSINFDDSRKFNITK